LATETQRAQRGDEGKEGMWRKDEREELATETQRAQRGDEDEEGMWRKPRGKSWPPDWSGRLRNGGHREETKVRKACGGRTRGKSWLRRHREHREEMKARKE